MKILIGGVLVSVLLFFCRDPQKARDIIIEGKVKNMPDGMIYLSQAYHWKTPLDSTECRNGHFLFKIEPRTSFVPFRAAIHFQDSTGPGNVGTLFFRNYTMGTDSNHYSEDAFYAEPGYTLIEGDLLEKPPPRIFAGPETDILFGNQLTDFGWLDYIDSAKRFQRLETFKKEIQRYPFSYFLLESIFNFKEQYSKEEMEDILSLFNKEVRESKLGDTLRVYLTYRPGRDEVVRNLSLLNPKKERHAIPDNHFALNMLVFWASWCGPCRREIPELHEIYLKYKDRGFNLVSISIDENPADWENALAQEKMDWQQYIVDAGQINIVMQQYNFSAVPFIVFTGNNGREIKRFSGYDGDSKGQYVKLIEETLGLK